MPFECDNWRKRGDPTCVAAFGSHIDIYCGPCLSRKLEGQTGTADARIKRITFQLDRNPDKLFAVEIDELIDYLHTLRNAAEKRERES